MNEAVELAHTQGILTATSLMMSGAAVADALARARRLPRLRVGLHLVLVDGAPLHYPHLSHKEIFTSLESFYKEFYFRPSKIASIVGEMVRSTDMMKRRLREGVEFFQFLRERREHAA